MSKPKTVYLVSSGSYSDYSVHAVFARKSDANRAVALAKTINHYGGDYFVEERDMYPAGEKPELVTTYTRMLNVMDDGSTEGHGEISMDTEPEFNTLYARPTPRPTVRYVRAPCHHGVGGRIEVRGSDEEAVNKTFTDLVAEWRADPMLFGKTRKSA